MSEELKLAALPIPFESPSEGLCHYIFLIVEQSEAMKTANDDEICKPSAIYPLNILAIFTARAFKPRFLGERQHTPEFEINNSESCAELSHERRSNIAQELKNYLFWSACMSSNGEYKPINRPFEMMGKFIYLKS
ncbi:hypothetical protein IKG06_01470 [Candidatus Saccharibacteria bacterium]|nr:hypothetical protein [Candidatus Saccharibacteria bacterium]